MRRIILFLALAAATPEASSAQTTITNCNAYGNRVSCVQQSNWAAYQQTSAIIGAVAQERAAETSAALIAAGRQAEQASQVARERAEQTAALIPELAAAARNDSLTFAPVNTEVPLDWRQLDGMGISFEMKGEQGVRRRVSWRFAVIPTPQGSAFLQFRVESKLVMKSGFTTTDLASEVLDGRYDPVTTSSFLSFSSTPLRVDVPPSYEAFALIGENALLAKMAGVSRLQAPVGTLPSTLLGPAIAAVAGELPDSLTLWVVDWNTATLAPAQLTRIGTQEIKIPVPREGVVCGDKVQTVRKTFATVTYHLRVGAHEEDKTYLTEAPHFAVPDGIKCLDLAR
jgi:hypothetical protein